MSELGETFKAWDEEKTLKKRSNSESSISILKENGIVYKILSTNGPHLRIGEYDFWAGTGLWINRKSRKRGRGIFNLLKVLQ